MLFHSKLLKFCPFKSRCPIETFPAYLKMKYCLLFHLKLWIFEKNPSFVFKSRCQIGSFVTYLTMEFCLFFSSKLLFRMDFWYEFKSCPFQTSCQTESLVAYLTMEPCVLFHDMNFWSEFKSCFKIWMSNWIFCLISHNGMFIQSFLSVWISGGFVWIFDLYRFHHGYEFKSCPFKVLLSFVNLLSRFSQWNFVCCFIQSYLPLKTCPFKSRCEIEVINVLGTRFN